VSEPGAEDGPAWSLAGAQAVHLEPALDTITRDWAWGGSTGKGVRVAIVDSGVEENHPAVGTVQQAVTIGDPDEDEVLPDTEGDVCGHGTACAGIVRSLAPDDRRDLQRELVREVLPQAITQQILISGPNIGVVEHYRAALRSQRNRQLERR